MTTSEVKIERIILDEASSVKDKNAWGELFVLLQTYHHKTKKGVTLKSIIEEACNAPTDVTVTGGAVGYDTIRKAQTLKTAQTQVITLARNHVDSALLNWIGVNTLWSGRSSAASSNNGNNHTVKGNDKDNASESRTLSPSTQRHTEAKQMLSSSNIPQPLLDWIVSPEPDLFPVLVADRFHPQSTKLYIVRLRRSKCKEYISDLGKGNGMRKRDERTGEIVADLASIM